MVPQKLFLGAAAIIAILALSLVVTQRGRGTKAPNSASSLAPQPTLEAVRVNPAGELGQETECSSFAQVDFTYRIINRGRQPISGLKVGTSCACEVIESPPAKIAPGQSALVGFRLRAPFAGRLQRQVPLFDDESSEPFLVLEAALRVKVDPPTLMPTPQDLTVSFVKGEDSARELVLEAIERKNSAPWLTGLELNPTGFIELLPQRMEELVELDAELTRRRYHFPLKNQSFDIGQHATTVMLRTRQDVLSKDANLPLRVAVVDSVAIVPNPLVIKYTPGAQPQPRKVSVIHRINVVSSVIPSKYDEHILLVRKSDSKGGSNQTFDVVPVRKSQSAFDTPVIFDIGNGEERELLVRFEESTSP